MSNAEDYYLNLANERYYKDALSTEEYERVVEQVLHGDPPAWMGLALECERLWSTPWSKRR